MEIYILLDEGDVYSVHKTRAGAEKRKLELLEQYCGDLTAEDISIITGDLED
ncbi:MAG: hypothetical protein WC554_04215 [Clostridia bacterium]